MQTHTWFTDIGGQSTPLAATVMEDVSLIIDASGLLTIDGPAGGSTTLDFDDAATLLEALAEAVQILRDRGATERADVIEWLQAHRIQDGPR